MFCRTAATSGSVSNRAWSSIWETKYLFLERGSFEGNPPLARAGALLQDRPRALPPDRPLAWWINSAVVCIDMRNRMCTGMYTDVCVDMWTDVCV